MRETHREGLKRERERVEQRVRDQVRLEVKQEVSVQFEEEYRLQFEKLQQQHNLELERIKAKQASDLARIELACQLPRPLETRFVEIQCDLSPAYQLPLEVPQAL